MNAANEPSSKQPNPMSSAGLSNIPPLSNAPPSGSAGPPFSGESSKIPEYIRNCVVAIHPVDVNQARPVGVGCVVGRNRILTTRRAVENTSPLTHSIQIGAIVSISLPWLPDHPELKTRVIQFDSSPNSEADLALLESIEPLPQFLKPVRAF